MAQSLAEGFNMEAENSRMAKLAEAAELKAQAKKLLERAKILELGAQIDAESIRAASSHMPKGWRQGEQERAILDWLTATGKSPLALQYDNGRGDGIKARAKDALVTGVGLFGVRGSSVFDKAWYRLQRDGKIKTLPM